MTKEELARQLNGRLRRNWITDEESMKAKENRLVIVFGASDDLMEFRGIITEEYSAFDGGIAYLDENGSLTNDCGDEDCPHFERMKENAITIRQIWHDSGEYIWTYETDIPHATFDILDEDLEPDKYCKAIVFSMDDLKDML